MMPITVRPTRADRSVANIISAHTGPRTERAAAFLTWGADEHILCALAAGWWLYCRDKNANARRASEHPPSGQQICLPRDAPPNHHRRRATATPNRNAINSEPRGASRAILLKMLNGIPGFRPASIAPLTRLTVPFTASETSAMVDFGSGTGSKPS